MSRIYRSFKYSLLECLAIFPLLLWINTLVLNDYFSDLKWLYFPLSYLITATAGWLIKKNSLKLIVGVLAAGIMVYTLSLDSIWHQLIILLLLFVSSMRGFQYSQLHLANVFPIGLIWAASLPSYFISYILYRGVDYTSEQQLLTTLALVLVFFLLFLTNQEHLSKASLIRTNVKQMNKKLRFQNSLYVFFFFMIVLLITRFNFIADGFVYLLRRLFILLGMGDNKNEIIVDDPVDLVIGDLGPTNEPSLWVQILDQILTIIGISVTILVCLFILYYLLKRIPFFAKKMKTLTEKIAQLLLRLRKGRSFEQTEGYVDETESVFDLTKSVDQFIGKLKGRFNRKGNWRGLTDKQKARRLYQEVIEQGVLQGYKFYTHETAQESVARLESELIKDQALTESLASIYDQARYSSLTPSQIEDLKDQFELKGWIR